MLESRNLTYKATAILNATCFFSTESLPICLSSLFLGSFNILINGWFLVLLYLSRRDTNWKRYAYVTNLAVSDFITNLILVGLIVFGRSFWSKTILKHALVGVMKVSLLSYVSSIFIQYYAVNKPLQYKAYTTMRKIKFSICFIWCIVILYDVIKISCLFNFWISNFIFSLIDPFFQGLLVLLNSLFYVFLVYISHRQKCDKTSKVGKKIRLENVGLRRNIKRTRCHPNTDETKFDIKEYYFVITIGLSLLIYWITTLPVWIYWVMLEITETSFYLHENSRRPLLFLVWLTRCFFDPLLHISRERKFVRSFKKIFIK